jgi:hypothetical protein
VLVTVVAPVAVMAAVAMAASVSCGLSCRRRQPGGEAERAHGGDDASHVSVTP